MAELPPILLEGDHPLPAAASGPGEKYAVGPEHISASRPAPLQLPASYGTGRLFLVARDPHWLYAHWDFTREQQLRFNTASEHGHLVLRIHGDTPQSEPISENHVHPESRHWFAHVEQAGRQYTAELGYYRGGLWVSVAASRIASTPRSHVSQETRPTFVTIPIESSLAKLAELAKKAGFGGRPLAWVLKEISAAQQSHQPRSSHWSREQDEIIWRTMSDVEGESAWSADVPRISGESVSSSAPAPGETPLLEDLPEELIWEFDSSPADATSPAGAG